MREFKSKLEGLEEDGIGEFVVVLLLLGVLEVEEECLSSKEIGA